jgi:hypothetical protein
MAGAEVKSINSPDETREFSRGRMEVVHIGGGDVGLMTLEPGWRWSEDVKPKAGTDLCEAPHFQYLISGRLGVSMSDGEKLEVTGGDVSVLAPGHDAWVIGDEQVVAIDWGGAHNWGKSG